MASEPAAEIARLDRLGGLAKLVFNFKLLALAIGIVSLYTEADPVGPTVMMLVASILSVIPLLFWERVGPTLLRHPIWLAADLILALIVLSITGAGGPLYYFTLGTAILAGVLYGWRGAWIFSLLLVIGYFVILLRDPIAVDPEVNFQRFVAFPALYPLTAAAGAAVRLLLDRQSDMEAELADESRAAAIERERARIAREMHDSLAKTLYGLSLQASAIKTWVPKDPQRATKEASALAHAAESAAAEARAIIKDLRSDPLEISLLDAMRANASEWQRSTGVRVEMRLQEVAGVSSAARWELLNIFKESLRNVERHAQATDVSVTLELAEGVVELSIADDGRGLETAADFAELSSTGHFGLIGMTERARSVGGDLELRRSGRGGLLVRATIPASASKQFLAGREGI